MDQSSPIRPVLRFCASCCITLGYWSLWLVLGASLASLLYVLTVKELQVPDFLLRRAEAQLAKADLTIKFGRARLDPAGRILLENVQIRSRHFEDPLLLCRLVYLQRDFWSVLAGRPIPDEIRLEGATLQLPAILSPSGTVEPLLRDLALVLRHDDHLWQVDQFTGRIGPLAVTAQGSLAAPAAGPRPDPTEIIARFLQTSRRLALTLHQLDAFAEPALAIRLARLEGVGNTADLLFTARGATEPWGQPLELGSLASSTTLRLGGEIPGQIRLQAAIGHTLYRGVYRAGRTLAVITAELGPDGISPRVLEAQLAAGSLTADGETVSAPIMRADLADWPRVHATMAAQLDAEFLTAEIETRLTEQTARLRAEGRLAPSLINRVLTRHTPRAAPYFAFADPISFRGEARLGPGWRFVSAAGRVTADRLDSRGVKITAARGQIEINGTDFLARDARVELDDNLARGSYWMDFATTDYRMLLTGRLKPLEINGWFRTDWWWDFWTRYFDFPHAPPEADVEVAGRWKDPTRTLFYGRAEARSATLWNGDFEQAQALIFLRPNFTHALELSAVRAAGTEHLAGSLKRFAGDNPRDTRRLEFDFKTDVAPALLGRMLDGRIDALLETFRFTRPPRVQLHGAIASGESEAGTDYGFTGQAEGGLHYQGFPLDTAQVSGQVTGTDIRLEKIQFTAAGGTGTGRASVVGPADAPLLGFDVYFNQGDLGRTIRAVEEYESNRTGEKTVSVAESDFMKRAAGGRLDLALSAQGRPGEINTFVGNGNATLTGAKLGEIHLFGLLSQVLSGLALNFSSLKLDAARTNFRLQSGRLDFPDLKITGPSAVIDARGHYVFDTNALDFTARLKPYEESRNILTATIGLVVNPLTSILELRLSGPLSKPTWSVFGSAAQTESPTPAPKTPTLPANKAKTEPEKK